MTAKKPKKLHKPSGRPSKKDAEALRKIEEVAALDGTLEEMASYADVNISTVVRWMSADPKLKARIEALRQRPVLKARQTAIKEMTDSYWKAMDYLKRKRKAEFGDNLSVDGMVFSPRIVMFGEDDPLKLAMDKLEKK